MASEAMVPRRFGVITSHRMRQLRAPSMRAASMTSRGKLRIDCASNRMASAEAKVRQDQRRQAVEQPQLRHQQVVVGIITTWNGTSQVSATPA